MHYGLHNRQPLEELNEEIQWKNQEKLRMYEDMSFKVFFP